jgi:hypothetical protein
MVHWAKNIGIHSRPIDFHSVEVLKNMPPSWVTEDMKEVPAFGHTAADNSLENRLSLQH